MSESRSPIPPGVVPPTNRSVMPPAAPPPSDADLEPIDLVDDLEASSGPSKVIRAIGVSTSGPGEQTYKRPANVTGRGAVRVRTFHAKLSTEGMGYLDAQINRWLDEHPEIEIKFCTTTIGTFEGKIREPALIVNVWY